jgi:hypothetical protein
MAEHTLDTRPIEAMLNNARKARAVETGDTIIIQSNEWVAGKYRVVNNDRPNFNACEMCALNVSNVVGGLPCHMIDCCKSFDTYLERVHEEED